MTCNILFAARPERWADYEAPLHIALKEAGVTDYTLALDMPPEEVDYIVYAPNSTLQDFTPYTRVKAVLTSGRGSRRSSAIRPCICRWPGWSTGR